MSSLANIYEQAFKKQRKEASSWGCLERDDARDDDSDPSAGKRKGPPRREYPMALFTLPVQKGPKGRTSYENRQKLQVVEYSRLTCADGNPVGNRGAAEVFGIDRAIVRRWAKQEDALKASVAGTAVAASARTLNVGRTSTTAAVEEALVDEINLLTKRGIGVNADIVMVKLLAEMPTWRGGLPSADNADELDKFRNAFNSWYYRFLKRHRFSIRRKTSVGQKRPEGWEGKAWAFIQKLRSVLLRHAKEAVILKKAAAAGVAAGGDTVEIDISGSPVTAEELLLGVQEEIFAHLYNMDQTPVQAEMPQTTLAPTGAKDARIATGGKEKLRYTVVLTVRGDGRKVKPRIIYKGTPFVAGRTARGAPKKPAANSLSHEHLPSIRTKYSYPAGGTGLGVQKASWCDNVQCDAWLSEDFMRRPGSTAFDQQFSILTLDDFRCHKDEDFQGKLKSKAKTITVMIGGGLTPICQPLDRTINKAFKRGMRAKYTHWVKAEFERGMTKASAPSRGLVATWVKEVWKGISTETIRTCFDICGLTLNLDGSQDHAWCTHTFGDKYREVLVEQRDVWEKAHGIELEPLELPVIPEGVSVNTVAAAAQALEDRMPGASDDDADEEGGIEDGDFEGADIEDGSEGSM